MEENGVLTGAAFEAFDLWSDFCRTYEGQIKLKTKVIYIITKFEETGGSSSSLSLFSSLESLGVAEMMLY
jgi:hypothetical protein